MTGRYQGITGNTYILEENRMARGGEGSIYQVQGQGHLVAKIFRPEKRDSDRAEKLRWMVQTKLSREQLEQVTWPQDVLYNEQGFAGYVMPKLSGTDSLTAIYSSGTSGKYDLRHRILAAINLCYALQTVHDMGQICGDLNPQNICINLNDNDKEHAFRVTLVDTDSYHFTAGGKTYRCEVGLADYLAPELQRELADGLSLRTAALPTYTRETDLFALAVHIFTLLMNGCHPFACAKKVNDSQNPQAGTYVDTMQQMDQGFLKESVVAPQPIENIRNGYFPFYDSKPEIMIPVYAPSLDSLPENLQNLFVRTFVDGYHNPASRVGTQEWIAVLKGLLHRVICCSLEPRHYYFDRCDNCPLCRVNQRIREMQQRIQGVADKGVPSRGVEVLEEKTYVNLPVPMPLPEPIKKNRLWLKYAYAILSVVATVILIITAVGGAIMLDMQSTDNGKEEETNMVSPIATAVTEGLSEPQEPVETALAEETEKKKEYQEKVERNDPWELSEDVINCSKFGGSIQIPQGAKLEENGCGYMNIELSDQIGEDLQIAVSSCYEEIYQDEEFNEYTAQTSFTEKPDERVIDEVLNSSMDAYTVIEACEFKCLNGIWYTMSIEDTGGIKRIQYWTSNAYIRYLFFLEVPKEKQLPKLQSLIEKVAGSIHFNQTEIYGKISLEDGSDVAELPGYASCEILLLKKEENTDESMVPSDHNFDHAFFYSEADSYTYGLYSQSDLEYWYVTTVPPGKYQALVTIWDDQQYIINSYTLEISVPDTNNGMVELDIVLADEMKLAGEE